MPFRSSFVSRRRGNLVTKFRLKGVYLEGLTAETVPAYREKAATLAAMQDKEIPELMNQLDEAKALKAEGARAVESEIREMLAAHRERVASIGTPGWLLMTGELAEVRPLDDPGPLAAADPRKADAATMKARKDAMVRNALAGGEPVFVIVLGAAHELSASIREADSNCGYIRLTTKKVAELQREER